MGKLIKGIKYGLKPIKMIYFNGELIYDTRVKILLNTISANIEDGKFNSESTIPNNYNMKYSVTMYAIVDPEKYNSEGISSISTDEIDAHALFTFDRFVDIFSKCQINDRAIENNIFNGSNKKANILNVHDSKGNPYGSGFGKDSPSIKLYLNNNDIIYNKAYIEDNILEDIFSFDNKIDFAIMNSNTGRIISITSHDTYNYSSKANVIPSTSNIINVIGEENIIIGKGSINVGKTKYTNLVANENKIFTKGHVKSNDNIDIIAKGKNYEFVISDPNGAIKVFINSNSDITNSTEIISNIDTTGANNLNVYSIEDINIKTNIDDVDANNLNVYSIEDINVKTNIDNITPLDVTLTNSNYIDYGSNINAITWTYPDQEGDILLVIQAHEIKENNENGETTLEVM